MKETSIVLLALALLGCAPKRGQHCDAHEADQLVAMLNAADPHEHPGLLDRGPPVCRTGLFVEGDQNPGLTPEGQTAFERACLADHDEVAEMLHSDRLGELYDACGFARFDVVTRDEYQLQPEAHPFPWALHQFMLDDGLSADQARPITRAWLVWQRARFTFTRLDGLRLPPSEGERDVGQALVQITASELAVWDRIVARVDDGELDDDEERDLLFELELEDRKHRMANAERWLYIAADIDAPRAILSDVMLAASRIGYTHFATVGEPRPYDYTWHRIHGPLPQKPPW